jgi:hypothetical protein
VLGPAKPRSIQSRPRRLDPFLDRDQWSIRGLRHGSNRPGNLRTISLKGLVWLSAQRRVNCCVRSTSNSEKCNHIRRRSFGSSNNKRIVCTPGSAARQPRFSPCLNADSIGCCGFSDETSTRAMFSRFNHLSSFPETPGWVLPMIFLRISKSRTKKSTGRKARSLGHHQVKPY